MTLNELRTLIRNILNEIAEWQAPEYESVDALAQHLMDDERDEFTHLDLAHLNRRTHKSVPVLRKELESYGFKLATREPERRVRGFGTSSHDRWYGPGSINTSVGAGIDPTTGRATVFKKTI